LLDFDFEHAGFDTFYSHLKHLVDKYTVLCTGNFQNPKDKSWFEEELRSIMKLWDKIYALKIKFILKDSVWTERESPEY
jgi:hypothetical protein